MNDHMEQTLQSREALVEQIEDAKMRLAFYDLQQEELSRLPDEHHTFLPQRTQSAAKHIAREVKRSARSASKTEQSAVGRIIRAACAVLLCAYLTTTVALALSPELRMGLAGALVSYFDGYMEITMPTGGFTPEAPEDWLGDYYPQWLPDGYRLNRITNSVGTGSFSVEYINEQGIYLYFDESNGNFTLNSNTDGVVISEIYIHDIPAMMIVGFGRCQIMWVEYGKLLGVSYDGEADVAINIAKNVRRVK